MVLDIKASHIYQHPQDDSDRLGIRLRGCDPESMQIEFPKIRAATRMRGAESFVVTAQSVGDSGELFEKLAGWLNDQVSKGILGQTASASWAPGGVDGGRLQAEVRDDIRDNDANLLAETITRDLICPFVDLNYGPQAQYPALAIKEGREDDVRSLTNALSKLSYLG